MQNQSTAHVRAPGPPTQHAKAATTEPAAWAGPGICHVNKCQDNERQNNRAHQTPTSVGPPSPCLEPYSFFSRKKKEKTEQIRRGEGSLTGTGDAAARSAAASG